MVLTLVSSSYIWRELRLVGRVLVLVYKGMRRGRAGEEVREGKGEGGREKRKAGKDGEKKEECG